MTLQEIIESGELAGYHEGVAGDGMTAVDALCCVEAACAACGHAGKDYRPYSKGTSYRAFAVCPACGQAEEF